MKGFSLSIQKKLIVMLVCWIAAFSCYGFFTKVKMKELSDITARLEYGPLKISNSAKEALSYVLKIEKGVSNQLLSESPEIIDEIEKENNDLEGMALEKLEAIFNYKSIEEIDLLANETYNKFFEWRGRHKEMLALKKQGLGNIDIEAFLSDSNSNVSEIEDQLLHITQLSEKKAKDFVYQSSTLVNVSKLMIYLFAGIIVLLFLLFMQIIHDISELMHALSASEEQHQLLKGQSRLLNTRNKKLRRSKQELLSYSRKLEEASRYKSEFLANMSHELRTPLNSIILLSTLLMKQKDEQLNQPQLEKLSIINSSGKELLRLIDEILDLSKIEAGRMDLNETHFYSGKLVKELQQLFQSFAEEKNIEFKVEDNASIMLFGDYNKISQILRNFLSNALKFTATGQVTLKVQLEEEERVVFAVTDTGIGISKENIDLIFEEFQQEDGSISRRFGGTGLGLSISKKLANLMGADIKVRSTVGGGSCFELYLGVKPGGYQELETDECATTLDILNEAKPEGQGYSYATLYHTLKANKEHSLRLDDRKILVVDDDPKNVFVMASILEACGAEILEAQDGETALELLKKEAIELILIDIMMPVMDGHQVIRIIREKEGFKDIPIIVVSAQSRRSDREQCMAAGANDYITKPVDYDNLIQKIDAWIKSE